MYSCRINDQYDYYYVEYYRFYITEKKEKDKRKKYMTRAYILRADSAI